MLVKITENIYGMIWTDYRENNCNTYLVTGRPNIIIDPGHRHLGGHVRQSLAELGLGGPRPQGSGSLKGAPAELSAGDSDHAAFLAARTGILNSVPSAISTFSAWSANRMMISWPSNS